LVGVGAAEVEEAVLPKTSRSLLRLWFKGPGRGSHGGGLGQLYSHKKPTGVNMDDNSGGDDGCGCLLIIALLITLFIHCDQISELEDRIRALETQVITNLQTDTERKRK
jgi:hypothetical protein